MLMLKTLADSSCH